MVHGKIVSLLVFLYLDTVNVPKAQIRSINAFWLEVSVAAFAAQYHNYRTYHGSEGIA